MASYGNSTGPGCYVNLITEVLNGLKKIPKEINSKFFYDEKGSDLFNQITLLKDYYLTQCEIAIIREYILHPDIFGFIDSFDIIELGSGDGSKAEILINQLKSFVSALNYFSIDISKFALEKVKSKLEKTEPSGLKVKVYFIHQEFLSGLKHAFSMNNNRKLVLFLGSSIGNMTSEETTEFLRIVSATLGAYDRLLIGFDLKKEQEVLDRAYNDSVGLTARFNLNLLTRFNKEFNANFNLDNFSHFAKYNSTIGAMESFLISNKKQSVIFPISGDEIKFSEGEKIHTEYSFKYDLEIIKEFARTSNLQIEKQFKDKNNYFCLTLFRKA